MKARLCGAANMLAEFVAGMTAGIVLAALAWQVATR